MSEFGTIGGLYTVAELKNLVTNKDIEMQALATAIAAFDPQWVQEDITTEQAWQTDWTALQARYNAAKTDANLAIAGADINLMPDTTIPADVQYKEVLTALQATEGVVSPGDFQDLWNRLVAAQGAPIPSPPLVQPTATDVDLNAMNTATTVLQDVGVNPNAPTAVGAFSKYLTIAGIGAAILIGLQAFQAFKPAARIQITK